MSSSKVFFEISDLRGNSVCLNSKTMNLFLGSDKEKCVPAKFAFNILNDWRGAYHSSPNVNIQVEVQGKSHCYLYVNPFGEKVEVKSGVGDELSNSASYQFCPVLRSHNLLAFHNNAAMAFLSCRLGPKEPLTLSHTSNIDSPESFIIHPIS